MVVRTGITCRHGQYPILACRWSGVDAGRRFLQCGNLENPCDFKYWIDKEFSGRWPPPGRHGWLEGKRANGQLQAPPRLGRDSAVLPPCARMRRGLGQRPGEGG